MKIPQNLLFHFSFTGSNNYGSGYIMFLGLITGTSTEISNDYKDLP